MIKKIYLENFKSFEKAEIQVENLTTLIGTNASGKSNAIEGLKILSELVTGRELSVILDGSKNMESMIRGGSQGCCRFRSSHFILGCLFQYDMDTDLKYIVDINVSDRIMIQAESLYKVSENDNQMLFETRKGKGEKEEEGDIKVSWNNGTRGKKPVALCFRSSSVISQIVAKLPQEQENGRIIAKYCSDVIAHLKNILFLNPEPNVMRGYSRINDTQLKVNASNLSAVLNRICMDTEKKNILLRVMRHLPENEISDISFAEGPLNDVILFIQEKYGNKSERIDATRLSDGTLRCLAITAALLSEEEKGMIVIEEVDNGIHPGRTEAIIRSISELARERNLDVMVTTHNATMLNALSKENLEGVDVFYRDVDSGASECIPLIYIERMAELLANGRLGDVVTSGKILDYIKLPIKGKCDYSWLEEEE
ncbi:MAG: AAA family ATPase [Lachnospiraceae bacterium]|nr:AAA family ATPase [Lachnospiraceae bacterium]